MKSNVSSHLVSSGSKNILCLSSWFLGADACHGFAFSIVLCATTLDRNGYNRGGGVSVGAQKNILY